MVSNYIIYLIYLIWLTLTGQEAGSFYMNADSRMGAELVVREYEMTAGESISVTAKLTNKNHVEELYLLVSHSWGLTTLRSEVINNKGQFLIDQSITTKTGDINITLYQDGIMVDSKNIAIQPAMTKSPEIESYHGPRSIKAGGEEYSMVISTLLDSLDNPFDAGVELEYNFMNGSGYFQIESRTKELYSYVKHYSDRKTGKVLAHITHQESGSSQRTINIVASDPQKFSLNYDRISPYANGAEPVKLFTSTVRDGYGNIVADGTLVEFMINGNDNSKIVASGITINGVAEVELPTPTKPVSWKMHAFITSFSKSKEVQIEWYSGIEQIPARYDEDSKILIVGPLKSRFNNLLPDGTGVKVTYKDQVDTLEYYAGTRNGMARIDLSNHDLQSETYNLNIESCGFETELKNNHSK